MKFHAKFHVRTAGMDSRTIRIIILCWFTYFIAYLGRYNYNACIVEIIAQYAVTRAEAGMVSSFFFFAYMIGQAVNAALSQRIDSVKFIGCSLAGAALVNIVMPFASPGIGMKALWCLNGVIQSALWPNCVKILTSMIPEKYIPNSLVLMHTTGAAGSAGAFLVSALCLRWISWQAAFFIPSIMLIGFSVLWLLQMTRIRGQLPVSRLPKTGDSGPAPVRTKINSLSGFRILLAGGFLLAALAAIGDGLLRDGINTWLPAYMHDTFNISSAFAVFISVVIPISQISGAFFARFIYHHNRDPFKTAMILYEITLGSGVFILLFGKMSIILTCVCFSVCATMMTSVNTALVSFFPLGFLPQGLTAMASGNLNAFVYIGSILAAFSFGLAADILGWNAVIMMICGAAALSAVFCFVGTLRT